MAVQKNSVRYRKHEKNLECTNGVENETDAKAETVFSPGHSSHIEKITPVKRCYKRVSNWCILVLFCGVTVLVLLTNRAPEVPYLKPPILRSKAFRFGSAAVAADSTICSTVGKIQLYRPQAYMDTLSLTPIKAYVWKDDARFSDKDYEIRDGVY